MASIYRITTRSISVIFMIGTRRHKAKDNITVLERISLHSRNKVNKVTLFHVVRNTAFSYTA